MHITRRDSNSFLLFLFRFYVFVAKTVLAANKDVVRVNGLNGPLPSVGDVEESLTMYLVISAGVGQTGVKGLHTESAP